MTSVQIAAALKIIKALRDANVADGVVRAIQAIFGGGMSEAELAAKIKALEDDATFRAGLAALDAGLPLPGAPEPAPAAVPAPMGNVRQTVDAILAIYGRADAEAARLLGR